MHWEVQIIGDSTDLRMLAEVFTEPRSLILARGDEYILQAQEFQGADSAQDVRIKAQEIITALSGACRLRLGSHVPIRVGAVYRAKDDGSRDIIESPEPVSVRVRVVPPTLTITKADGSKEIYQPAEPIARWITVSMNDEAVAKVLRLRNEDLMGWVDLYRIYEVVEGDIGLSTIHEQGWASRKAIERFTRTANSVAAVGDQSRHGKERTQPPENPCALSEARALVDQLVISWIEYKVRQSD